MRLGDPEKFEAAGCQSFDDPPVRVRDHGVDLDKPRRYAELLCGQRIDVAHEQA